MENQNEQRQLTQQESINLALQIESMKPYLHLIDTEYARFAAKKMRDQAHWQRAAAVLNPSHPELKNKYLQQQGDALDKLVDFIESLKECDHIKGQLSGEVKAQEETSKLFF